MSRAPQSSRTKAGLAMFFCALAGALFCGVPWTGGTVRAAASDRTSRIFRKVFMLSFSTVRMPVANG